MARLNDKRERLVESANTLIHKQGFHQTTLADIARDADVPLGNVYYYFKTKDDIGQAVVVERRQGMKDQMAQWSAMDDPQQRLLAFLEMPQAMSEVVAEHGCPIGSLCQELKKDPASLALTDKADAMLQDQLEWVTAQFRAMEQAQADAMGLRFIASLQGASLIANATHDSQVLIEMADQLRAWVATL